MADKKIFDKKLNYDVATEEKIQKTNEELVEYLGSQGEVIAAEQVQRLIDTKKSQEAQTPPINPINEKLLNINTQILAILERMHEDMYDEQDTSIKKISNRSSITGKLGKGASAVGAGVGAAGSAAAAGLGGLASMLKGVGGAAAALMLGKMLKGQMSKAFNDKLARYDEGRRIRAEEEMRRQQMEKEEQERKRQEAQRKKAEADKRASDSKSQEKKTTAPKKAPEEPKKPEPKKPADKPAKPQKPVKQDPKVPKPKEAPPGLAKKIAKFGKLIPGLGLLVTGVMSVDAMIRGYYDAHEYLGKDRKDTTDSERVAMAAGMVAEDLTFGLFDGVETGKDIIEFMADDEKDKIIEKYEKLNVYESNMITKDDILNWHYFENGGAKSKDIKELMSVGEFTDEDEARLAKALLSAEKYEAFDAKRKAKQKAQTDETNPKALPQKTELEKQNEKVNQESAQFKELELKKMNKQIELFEGQVDYLEEAYIKAENGDASIEEVNALRAALQSTEKAKQNLIQKRNELKGITDAEKAGGNNDIMTIHIDGSSADDNPKAMPKTPSQPLTIKKETQVIKSSQNLQQQTKAYDMGTATQAAHTVMISNKSINNQTRTEKPDDSRLLGLFT